MTTSIHLAQSDGNRRTLLTRSKSQLDVSSRLCNMMKFPAKSAPANRIFHFRCFDKIPLTHSMAQCICCICDRSKIKHTTITLIVPLSSIWMLEMKTTNFVDTNWICIGDWLNVNNVLFECHLSNCAENCDVDYRNEREYLKWYTNETVGIRASRYVFASGGLKINAYVDWMV